MIKEQEFHSGVIKPGTFFELLFEEFCLLWIEFVFFLINLNTRIVWEFYNDHFFKILILPVLFCNFPLVLEPVLDLGPGHACFLADFVK